MYGMFAESHIIIRTYVGREGSYNMISPVTSVLNINEASWRSSLK